MTDSNLAAFVRLVNSGRAVFRVRSPGGQVADLNVEDYIALRVKERLGGIDAWAELVDVLEAPKPEGTT